MSDKIYRIRKKSTGEFAIKDGYVKTSNGKVYKTTKDAVQRIRDDISKDFTLNDDLEIVVYKNIECAILDQNGKTIKTIIKKIKKEKQPTVNYTVTGSPKLLNCDDIQLQLRREFLKQRGLA